jgi:hypothetical protein
MGVVVGTGLVDVVVRGIGFGVVRILLDVVVGGNGDGGNGEHRAILLES